MNIQGIYIHTYKHTHPYTHTYNRRLPGLCLFRDNTPNPQETGGPREFRGWGWGGESRHPLGDRVVGWWGCATVRVWIGRE